MKELLFSVLCYTFLMVSCDTKGQVELLDKEQFNTTIDGKQVSLYTLSNKQGTTMQVTNFGARVVALWTADRDGAMADIVLGYENIDRYVNNHGERFLGATIGRYGNRIADGRFTLDSVDYQLSTYDNGQCLHGGDKGFDMVVWSVDSLSEDYIAFSYLSRDMEEGFPGNLSVQMTYELTPDNEFRVTHRATTDKPTPVNLTHHSFFNLLGEGGGTINEHVLTINADHYTPVNENLIPLGSHANVGGSPFDFRTPTAIGSRLGEDDQQFDNCRGYDHNFVLNRRSVDGLELAATVYEPQSGREMQVLTTEPGLQFYGGNFFDGSTVGKTGKALKFRESFALETQHFPDSPNQPTFPSTILRPGEEYHHICVYRFSAR